MNKKAQKDLSLKLPSFLHQYFWEVDADKINPQKEVFYVVERLMDRGDLLAFKWLKEHFSRDFLKQVAVKSKNISRFNKTFWYNYLDIIPKEKLCSRKAFPKRRKTVWPY